MEDVKFSKKPRSKVVDREVRKHILYCRALSKCSMVGCSVQEMPEKARQMRRVDVRFGVYTKSFLKSLGLSIRK